MLALPLHSNGSYSIVACVSVAAGMCLPSRCLAMNVYAFTIPDFCHHVKILNVVVSRLNARLEIEQHSEIFVATSHWHMTGLLLHDITL
jgi:hypothetical protein